MVVPSEAPSLLQTSTPWVGYMPILNIGAQNRNCMEHDEDGPIPISPKQWIELFKMMPPIGKAFLIVSQLIVLGVIGYVLLG